jgi:hypothetical protein
MNPIEKDLKNYYGTSSDSDILEHYGTKRHSGRYPWGSGDNPYQHSGDFLSRVETLKKKGMSENEILNQINSTLPKEYQLGLTEFRVARRKAIHERKASEYEKIAALKEQGLGWKAIGEKLGMSESSVRSKYAGTADKKAQRAENIADTLKKEVDKKGMIDISEGANLVMGVSQSELDDAAYTLEAEYGYKRYGVGIRQPTNIRQQTNITVLAKPEFDQKYAYQHQDQIDSLGDYHSDDGGDTFKKLQRPASLDSSRVAILYGDEGGLDKDGVIEIRRGVPDLDLGKSHYAQVRILVDGDHYLKGMAVYSDALPDGADIMFNTNKPSGTPKMKVLKEAKADPDNPFGAAIKANGQSKVPIKSTRPLEQLKGFDPKTAYAVPEGNPNNVRLMKKEEKQREMGVISNLITDMTLRGASEEELARAVKHSMVVIDAEKHKLDYKRSERENGIQELKEKWQIRVDEDGTTHYGGASTLLSRRKQTIRVPERRGSVRVDKETGELIYKESGRAFIDPKTKKERIAEDTVSLISETKDARTLS